MVSVKSLLVLSLIACSHWVGAEPAQQSAAKPALTLTIDNREPGFISIDARQAPLSQILDDLSAKTGVKIHYSVLPTQVVTATCAGTELKAIMNCLVGADVGLAFRDLTGQAATYSHNKPKEMWILGSSLVATDRKANASGCVASSDLEAKNDNNKADIVASDEAVARMAALAEMSAGNNLKDGRGKAIAEQNLTHSDPRVRIQAINALDSQSGAENADMLLNALSDDDANVRLMAVQRASLDANGLEVLKSAASDSDATVRQLANLKLQRLAGSTQ